jgi:hypothetical protein
MTKYVEAKDEVIDKRLIGNLSPVQKAAFKKLDEKHRKVKTQEADNAIDRKIIAKVKKIKNEKTK